MGWRFQKRLRILPGVTLNISKSGLSTSFGVRGARITKGHGQTRVTMGLPGSGLSHSVVRTRKSRGAQPPKRGPIAWALWALFFWFVFWAVLRPVFGL